VIAMTESPRIDVGPNRSALYSLEAEEAVLGSVLINPDAYFEVAPFLRADDFYLHKHRWIWEVFVHLHDQRIPVDFITVSQELDNRRLLDEAGGVAYLTHLLNTVPTSLHAEAYGQQIQRDALRRRLLEAATSVAKLAYAEERDINEVVNDAEAAVFSVSEQRTAKDIIPIREAISTYFDQVKMLSEHKGEMLGVPTGFYDLDKVLGGLQRSDLLIIAGRPGSGKTGFMISVAKNAAQIHKKHVAVFSLEMSNEQLVQRLMAQETGIDSQRLRSGEVRDDEWPLFVEAASALGEAPIFLDDTPALTPLQLHAKCRRLDQEFGLDLIIVDYLQLMQATTTNRDANRVQEVSEISRGLKALARELSIPVIALSQLSRQPEMRESKEPRLSDLRESGAIEQDADLVMFLYREKERPAEDSSADGEVVTLKLAKHRNGPTGEIQLWFKKSQTRFVSYAGERFAEAG
jgi:replicative DNA helicase